MPRKTPVRADKHFRHAGASMRPRPDAAENDRVARVAWRGRRASMRPRPDAAENLVVARAGVRKVGRFNEAAARCRGKQPRLNRRRHHRAQASMRPRPDAAENQDLRGDGAARPLASMRPRPDAAENC